MQMIPGKLDCTRSRLRRRNLSASIILLVIFLWILTTGLQAQSSATPEHAPQQSAPPQYPEVAWLGPSSYCNPFFGFRLALPSEFKSDKIYLPVQQPQGGHVLLALYLQRLGRSAQLFVSAFQDSSENPAHLAAKARVKQAQHAGLNASGPREVSIHEHKFSRLDIIGDPQGIGVERSFYFAAHGYVIHFAIFSHQQELAGAVESAILQRIQFADSAADSCAATPALASSPAAVAADLSSAPTASVPNAAADPHTIYGPALPTALVDETLRQSPGLSIPSGEFSNSAFTDPALGVRFELLPRWQPLPAAEAYRVLELMRDPQDDPASSDRRRALFRACSRVLFAAADPSIEITAEVHPGLAIVAMPLGCVPDMMLPTADDHAGAEDFATIMARSLGLTLLAHGHVRANPQGRLVFHLDGTLPYRIPGEKLSRRLSLRVSAVSSGNWLLFVYTVAPTPAAEREFESRVAIASPAK